MTLSKANKINIDHLDDKALINSGNIITEEQIKTELYP